MRRLREKVRVATANGLTYRHLAQALRREEFTETVDARGRTFERPSGARLPLPALDDAEPLRLFTLLQRGASSTTTASFPPIPSTC